MGRNSLLYALCLASWAFGETADIPAAAPPHPPDPYSDPGRISSLEKISGASLYFEEDFVFPSANEDRNYTGGLGINLYGDWIHELKLTWPLEKIDGLFGSALGPSVVHSAMVGLTAFTPDSLNVEHVIVGDRPYGSLVFLSTGVMHADPGSNLAVQSGLTYGMLGLDWAKDIQTWVHRTNRKATGKPTPYDPLGWHHQIANGNEFTMLYDLRLNYQVLSLPDVPEPQRTGPDLLQLSMQAEASAGYYTNMAVGSTLRLGVIRSRFWQFNTSPMTMGNQALDTQPPSPWNFELYFFGALRYRVVAYNALLQGGLFTHSDYAIPDSQINRTLDEFDFGAALNFWRINFTYLIFSGRTAEFSGPYARTHTWGSFFLSYRRPFGTQGG